MEETQYVDLISECLEDDTPGSLERAKSALRALASQLEQRKVVEVKPAGSRFNPHFSIAIRLTGKVDLPPKSIGGTALVDVY